MLTTATGIITAPTHFCDRAEYEDRELYCHDHFSQVSDRRALRFCDIVTLSNASFSATALLDGMLQKPLDAMRNSTTKLLSASQTLNMPFERAEYCWTVEETWRKTLVLHSRMQHARVCLGKMLAHQPDDVNSRYFSIIIVFADGLSASLMKSTHPSDCALTQLYASKAEELLDLWVDIKAEVASKQQSSDTKSVLLAWWLSWFSSSKAEL